MAGSPITEELEFLKAVVVKRHVVPADAEQCADAPQLSLEVNEIVYVLEQDESGWWGGHKEGHEETKGWFPGNCVRVVSDDSVMSETAWGGVFPDALPEEEEDGGNEDSVLASRGPAVPHAVGAMRLSTPTFPGASEDDPSNPRVAVAADGSVQGAERSFQFQAALSTAEVRASGEELTKALSEIEELKAANELLRHQSQQTIQMLQHRSEAAEKEAQAARQELERQSKRQADIQEELQRTKRHSEVQVSELKNFFEQQMQQKQQKEVELNKQVADIAARCQSLRSELHENSANAAGCPEKKLQTKPANQRQSTSVDSLDHQGKQEPSQHAGSTRSVAEELHHAKRHSEVQVSELKRFFEQQSQPKQKANGNENDALQMNVNSAHHGRGSHSATAACRRSAGKDCLARKSFEKPVAPRERGLSALEVKLDVVRDDPPEADPSPLGLVETIGRSRPRAPKPTGNMTTALPAASPVR
mmetsp:Transcript_8232/g.19354  ORF Transcript_8232/g.19354 Transcript_8232/m.19354 type:complete len:475 (-) Transcript_8232:102-1526(-)